MDTCDSCGNPGAIITASSEVCDACVGILSEQQRAERGLAAYGHPLCASCGEPASDDVTAEDGTPRCVPCHNDAVSDAWEVEAEADARCYDCGRAYPSDSFCPYCD